jgi:hypothetical protein
MADSRPRQCEPQQRTRQTAQSSSLQGAKVVCRITPGEAHPLGRSLGRRCWHLLGLVPPWTSNGDGPALAVNEEAHRWEAPAEELLYPQPPAAPASATLRLQAWTLPKADQAPPPPDEAALCLDSQTQEPAPADQAVLGGAPNRTLLPSTRLLNGFGATPATTASLPPPHRRRTTPSWSRALGAHPSPWNTRRLQIELWH